MLPGVVAADDRGGGVAGVQHLGNLNRRENLLRLFHLKSVGHAFASLSTIEQDCWGGGGVRVCEHHRVKVDPDFANVARRLADCVRAGVCVSADGEDLTELSNL